MRELENCLIRFKMFKNTDWTGWTDDGFIINTYHDPYRARLSSLRLSIIPNTPIVKRDIIPTTANKACLYIFSFASASLSCRYFTRYFVICAIFNAVDTLSFIRFITSLFIVLISCLYERDYDVRGKRLKHQAYYSFLEL